jgi:hypothetical protein
MNSASKYFTFTGRPLILALALTLVTLTLSLAWPQAAPAQGTWSETGRMANGRYYHTSPRLADGRVLVAGGTGNAGLLASAELFNPATGTWSAAAPLATARANLTATRLADGRVLMAGGAGNAGFLTSAEVYDSLNFLSNGSFESAGVDPGVGFITLPNGDTTITQWLVASGGHRLYRGILAGPRWGP